MLEHVEHASQRLVPVDASLCGRFSIGMRFLLQVRPPAQPAHTDIGQ